MGRWIAGLFGGALLMASAISIVASAAEDEAQTKAALDAPANFQSTPGNPARPRGNVAVFEVDAEAGLHPRRPTMGDKKVPTDDGHAYWVRAKPSLPVDIVDVGLTEDGRMIWLRVTDETAARFHEFTSTHVGRQFVLVVDGRIIGEPATIMTPGSGTQWMLSESNPLVAFVRCVAFERVKQGSAGGRSSAISNCQLQLDRGN